MSKRTYKRIFRDEAIFNSMIQLRKMGFSYLSLATIFGIDHSSIYAKCKKYSIIKGDKDLEFGIKYIIELEPTIYAIRPKSYKEYIDQEKNRKISQLTKY